MRVASRNAEHARALAAEVDGTAYASFEEAVDGADVVCACTDAGQPIFAADWLAPGMHVTSVGASRDGPGARSGDHGPRPPRRRVARRLRALPGGRARAAGARSERRRRAGRDPRRHARGAHLSRARSRSTSRWAMRSRMQRRPGSSTGARSKKEPARRSSCDRARRDRGRARPPRRLDRPHSARAPRARGCSGGDLPQAREPPADRLVQAARRGERAPARLTGGARARRVDRERRQHGPGRRLVGPQARRALHGRPSGHGPGNQGRGDQAAGRER